MIISGRGFHELKVLSVNLINLGLAEFWKNPANIAVGSELDGTVISVNDAVVTPVTGTTKGLGVVIVPPATVAVSVSVIEVSGIVI